MCFSPVTIRNPRIDFKLGLDSNLVTVPCGHCLECRSRKRDDWYVRLYYEFMRYKEKGCIVFPTFTYNDDHLPLCDSSSQLFDELASSGYVVSEQFQFKGFDKIRLINAIRKLRTRLSRDGVDGIKYFVVCERGEDVRYTFRPHYHCFFFIPVKLDAQYLKNQFEYAWSYKMNIDEVPEIMISVSEQYFETHPNSNLFCPQSTKELGLYNYIASRNKYGKINYFRKRGNVSYSFDDETQSYRPFVENTDSLKYITKYLAKQQSYEKDENQIKYSNFVHSLPSASCDDLKGPRFASLRKLINEVKSFEKFTLSSNNIGMDLFDDLDIRSQLVTTYDSLLRQNLLPNKISIEGEYYAIPTYITDKLFYSTSDVVRYEEISFANSEPIVDYKTTKKRYYTALGKEVVSLRLQFKVNEMSKKFSLYLDPKLNSFLKSLVFDGPTFASFENVLKEQEVVFRYINGVSYELLSYYKLCLQNVVLPDDLPITQDFDFISFCKDMYIFKLNNYGNVTNNFNSPLKNIQTFMFVDSLPVFNNLSQFRGFDSILRYVDTVKGFLSFCRLRDREKKNHVGDKIKQFFNNFLYV